MLLLAPLQVAATPTLTLYRPVQWQRMDRQPDDRDRDREIVKEEQGIKEVTQVVLELGPEEGDCVALVSAILPIHPHSMERKDVLSSELWWMKTVMSLIRKSQKATAAQLIKPRSLLPGR